MACRDIDLVLYLQTKQLVDSGASFAARSLVHFFTGCSKEVGRWRGGMDQLLFGAFTASALHIVGPSPSFFSGGPVYCVDRPPIYVFHIHASKYHAK